ncbi:hypothetical protein [Acidilobus sp. 7A]|uniref:hypothetical protein n=1 Tax=Acidilobus sp. 7A TaxID=1577685 RepID=UPI000E3C63FB|nr:hypothetical protein [Acidilobus sp. 7A]
MGDIVAINVWGPLAAVIPKHSAAGLTLGLTVAFMIISMIIDLPVIGRTSKMCSAAKEGDIAALKSLNSLGWAIVALIFSGVIPGVLLFIDYGRIEDLPSLQS